MHFENIDLYLWLVSLENSEIRSKQIDTMEHVCIVCQNHPNVLDHISIKQYAGLEHVVFELPGATMPRPMAEAYASTHNIKIVPAPIPAEIAIFLMWNKRLDNDTGHQWLRNTD